MTCGYTTIIITIINSGSHLNVETFPLLLSADSQASKPQHMDHITRKKNVQRCSVLEMKELVGVTFPSTSN